MGRHQSWGGGGGVGGGRQHRQRDENEARSRLKTAQSLCPAWEGSTQASTMTVAKTPREGFTMTVTVILAFHWGGGGQLPFSAAEQSTEPLLGSHVPDVH